MTTGNLTIQDNDTVDQYISVGESSFVFNFPILTASELKVSRNQVLLVYGADYSISGLGADGGGTITLLTGASTPGDVWTLWQDMPIERLTGFSPGAAALLPEALNADFARAARVEQQLLREIRNSLRIAPDDTSSGQDMVIPDKALRAGKFAAYDASGNPTVSDGTGGADSALRADLANPLVGGNTLVSVLRHDAEAALGIAIVRGHLPVGQVDRYGSNNSPGTTDMLTAWNAACKLGRLSGHEVTYGDTWPYRVSGSINCTTGPADPIYGFAVRNLAQQLAVTFNAPSYPSILAAFNGGNVFDMSGSQGITFVGVTVGVPAGFSPANCWLMARNSIGGGSMHKFFYSRVYGPFSNAVWANYGAEDDEYHGCQGFNSSNNANASVLAFTSNNNLGWTSSFLGAGLAVGQQSTIGHMIHGGAFGMVNGNAAAATITLDEISLMKVFGPHLIASGCKAFIRMDSTNGDNASHVFVGVSGENVGVPTYGIYIGDAAANLVELTVIECRLPHVTKMIRSHANVQVVTPQLINVDDSGIGGGGIDFAGIVNSPAESNTSGRITYGTLVNPNFKRLPVHIQCLTDASLTLRDDSAGAGLKGYRWRSSGGQVVLSLLDDNNAVVSSPLVYNRATGRYAWTGIFARPTLQASASYANDAAAAAGGVAIGDEYRNGSVVQIRIV